MIASFSILLLGSVAALEQASYPPPNIKEIVDFDYNYARAAWGLTCLGYDHASAKMEFDRQFGERKRRIDHWAITTFGHAQINAKRNEEHPADFVMVGGCRVDRRTRRPIDPTPEFARRLRVMERRISKPMEH